MSYNEIIKKNVENAQVNWWPKYAYHYTDITNVVSILKTGYLYSRVKANEMNLMINDNASRQVIDMTDSSVVSYVRFYFRPLTPTQYYNEGFKHPLIRYDQDENANVPVPVFFLFNLEKLLNSPGICFSEKGQAGYGSEICCGEEEFNKLDFDKIYSNEYVPEYLKYKRAELLIPNAFSIQDSLVFILCRNEIEKTSVLNLLKETNPTLLYQFESKIKIGRENVFVNNGLFITSYSYHESSLSFTFSDTFSKKTYTQNAMTKYGIDSLSKLNARAEFEWYSGKKQLFQKGCTFTLTYDGQSIKFNGIPEIKDAKVLKVSLFVEDKLMCLIEHPLWDSELI